MNRAFPRLLAVVLLLGCRYMAPASDEPLRPPAVLTLTNEHPEGSFRIDSKTLNSAPPILVIRVTKVVNPEKTAVHLLVYLSFQSGPKRREPQKIRIADLGFYPPDRPGGFLLRASEAFHQLQAARPTATDVRVLLELQRIHEAKPWTNVEVTVAPPAWKSETTN